MKFVDLKLDSKIRLYRIRVGDNHASWDPSGSWERGSLLLEMTSWEAILGNKTLLQYADYVSAQHNVCNLL